MVMVGQPVRDMPLVIRCKDCRQLFTLDVNEQDFQDWKGGKHCQVAFPYLDAGDRELLISATCSSCWKKLFGGDEDEGEVLPAL